MPGPDLSIIAHIVHDPTAWAKIQDAGIILDHFIEPKGVVNEGRRMFAYITDHFSKHGKIPSVQTIWGDLGMVIPAPAEVPEPVGYYIDRLRRRALDSLVGDKTKAQLTALDKGDSPKAVEAAKELLQEISRQNLAGEPIYDWTKDTKKRWDEYEVAKATAGGMIGLSTPWPILNEMTQGAQKGDLWIIVARPGCGKTWIEVVLAKHWWVNGSKVLLVTLEMSMAKVARRLDSTYLKLDYRNLRKGKLGFVAEGHYTKGLATLQQETRALHIVTRKRAKTVVDVAILIEQLRPDIVVIDGIYKFHTPDASKNAAHWEKMMMVVDALQELAQEKDVPIIASTQFSRQVKKGQTNVDISSIAFADAVGMNADVVIGILPSDEMRDVRETLIRVLKNREDELVAFRAKFDVFDQNFDQIALWEDPKEDASSGKKKVAKSTEAFPDNPETA